jgi:DNA-binding transcriptional ArsR family regulator
METIRIHIGDADTSDEVDKEIWKDPERFAGQHVIVVPPHLFSKIFTKERLRLLKALERRPKNVGELVAMLGRPREAVSRDLKYLSSLGLINLEKNGKERVPTRTAQINVAV